MAVRGGLARGLAVVLLALLAVHWAERAEAAKTSALCSKFPTFCEDHSELDDDKRGKSTHQRFAETKWRKPKGDTEIRGHLAPKRPKNAEAVELDDAAALRAATIREAEEKLRLTEGGRAAAAGKPSEGAFDKRRTVEDARRKAHLIKEARRKRRQRLEEAESEEDDEDEMVVEVEEDEEEEDDEDDDDAVVEDEDSEEDDDEEDSEELVSAEDDEQEEEEEYVEEAEEEEEEEEEEEQDSDEVVDLHDDEPEDDDERLARKKLHESVMRRRKWKEEEARMRQREEDRKRAQEEERKKDEDVRKRRIEEMRKRKRQEEEARRQKEDEEERKREEEEERKLAEERAKKEAEHRRVREEREKEEQRRLEEKVREERRRREEEKLKQEELKKGEEERRKELERQELELKEAEERKQQEVKKKKEEQDEERDRKLALEKELKRKAEDERNKKAEEERRKRAEDEERERKRKSEEEEKERKRNLEEAEKERKRQAEEEERERKRKAEQEEKERKRKLEEDERKRKLEEEEKALKKKAEDEEKERKRKAKEQEGKLKAEEESKKRKQEEESKKKRETEEKVKPAAGKEAEKPKKQTGDEVKKEKVAAKAPKAPKEDQGDDEEDLTAWMSGFPEFFAPTADDDVKSEECRKQSRIFVRHLAKYKTWALSMYDATAKLPSGLLSGNAIQLGDFDECLGVDVRLRQRSAAAGPAGGGGGDEDADVLARAASWLADLARPVLEPVLGAAEDPGLVHIRGQYCLAGVDLELRRHDTALRSALDRTLGHSFLRGSLNDSAHFVPRFRTLGWGVCVPAACSPRDVELALRAAVARFQRSGAWGAGLVRARVALPTGACRVAPPPLQRLPPAFFLAVGGLAALLLLVLVATLRDAGQEPDELGGLAGVVASFSLRRNWSTLVAREDPGADDIRCIHGIRGVCSLLLYVAHKLLQLATMPFSNRSLLAVMGTAPASMLLRGSLVYTDTFLMLSGTLAAFHLSRQLGRGGSLDWISRLFTRVVRLTPTLALVTVTYAYVLEHIGTGPMWGQMVEENGRICREHMWRNLLYVSNLWPFEQMCAPHTHQLALDMQLSLLVPPLVWLLVKAWPLASPIILVLIGGSTWLRQQAALEHSVSLLVYHGAKPADLYRAADVSYIQAPHRATSYLAGVALGYLLHRVPKKLQVPKALLAVGWLGCAALGGWALFSHRHMARFGYRLDVADCARFNALAPLAWTAAVAWVIFACYVGHGGWLDRLLCARPLVLLSRVSYAFYLVQFLVFFYNAGSVRSQKEFSFTAALDLWELVLVLVLATIITLLVELPMQSVRSAFGGRKRRQSLKWDPPSTPTTPSPHDTAAAYYYNPASDVYTSHDKEE